MTAETIIQSLASGLLMGLLYGLIAVGLALIFGLMDVVNFAHGEFLMIAMYATFFLFVFFAIDPLLSAPLVAAGSPSSCAAWRSSSSRRIIAASPIPGSAAKRSRLPASSCPSRN